MHVYYMYMHVYYMYMYSHASKLTVELFGSTQSVSGEHSQASP